MNINICTLSDSYKMNHWKMYPNGTEKVYSYFESRTGAKFDKTLFFGLQVLLKKYLEGKVVTKEKIDSAEKLINVHLGAGAFNREGWEHILNEHNGYLPVEIKAISEGTLVDVNNVLMTVVNTDPKCFWLTNYLETVLTHVWSASTVATLSKSTKCLLMKFAEETAETSDHVQFQLHDFGFRGVSSVESAGFEGVGHLINFSGTDTIHAIEYAMEYYHSDVCAFSVPATEHSIQTSLGKEGEEKLIGDLLDKYPTGILSLVIDSYDYLKFIEIAGTKYKDKILNRDGRVVFRPDSGNPIKVSVEVINSLGKYFGYTDNKKGYKVLNDKVRMLWGDGIDQNGMQSILAQLRFTGWSSENIIFGMGGGLLQKVNRDTQRFAFKSSAQKRNGKWYDIFKDPIDKSKISKKGKLKLIIKDGKLTTSKINENVEYIDYLETVFKNGKIIKEYTFDEVKRNSEQ